MASAGNRKRRRHTNQRRKLRWAQRSICAGCGEHLPGASKVGRRHPDNATFDHVLPRSRGGTHALTNGLLKHYRCNQARGDAPPTGCDLIWHDYVGVRLEHLAEKERLVASPGAANAKNSG